MARALAPGVVQPNILPASPKLWRRALKSACAASLERALYSPLVNTLSHCGFTHCAAHHGLRLMLVKSDHAFRGRNPNLESAP